MRAGCGKAEPKFSSRRMQTQFPAARDGQNLISWKWSLPSPTDPVWCRSLHAISSRGNRPPTYIHTHTATHPATDRQDRLQYTAPQLARSVNISFISSARTLSSRLCPCVQKGYTVGVWHDHQQSNACRSDAVSKQRDAARISAERRDVVVYPAQRGRLVQQSVVTRQVLVSR